MSHVLVLNDCPINKADKYAYNDYLDTNTNYNIHLSRHA